MLSYKAQGILKRLAIFLVFAVFLFFLLRNIILEAAIHHLSTKIKKDYNAELNVKESYFEGFLTICFNKLSVLTDPNDTIIQVDTIKITPSLFSLLTLRIRINSLDINHARMNLICHEDNCNFKI